MATAQLETLLEGVEALRIIPEPQLQAESKAVAEPPYLLFSPPGMISWLRETFDDVPRYLFRVFTPMSRGTTDRKWTKSMDATDGRPSSKQDVFSRNDQQVAAMINRHLRWMHGPEDNLVSWTSSLLFALVYIFHLHASTKDGSVMDDISLCVIDTTKFPKGVFLRDMDLIFAYHSFDKGLMSFEELRQKKHKLFSGSYYFGEYLSQGALKIEDRCQIVSAQRIIDEGLYDLQPDFEKFLEWGSQEKALWAEPVVAHREQFYRPRSEFPGASMDELEAAVNIAQLFGPGWRLPVAANLLALCPRPVRDSGIVLSFRGAPFTDEEREECSPTKTKIVASSTLPEVQQYAGIMRDVYTDVCSMRMKDHIREAEAQLRHAISATRVLRELPSAGNGTMSTGLGYADVQRRLRTVARLTRLLLEELLPAGAGAVDRGGDTVDS